MDNLIFKSLTRVYWVIGLVCITAPFLLILIVFIPKSVPTAPTAIISGPSLATSSMAIMPATTEDEPRKTNPPPYIRGIYLTAYSASREQWRRRLIAKMKNGRINSVVIDIKDYSGYVLYDSQLPILHELKIIKPRLKDVKGVLAEFHEAGIYVIARLTVFQDPALVRVRPDLAVKTYGGYVWHDSSGLTWTDPQNQEVWDYNVAIAKEAAALGFDEINFDYIRYPSDGNLKIINFHLPSDKSKSDILEEFFTHLSDELSALTNISIDMFGLVLDNAKRDYDLGIGQRLGDAVDNFDYICPMVYPSHYPASYLGLGNPAAYPKAVVSYDIKTSQPYFEGKRASLRPWLQAFNLGAVYDKYKIEAQIEATETATSTTGWLLWNARNYYPDYIF